MESFHDRIARLRRDAHLTQDALAQRLGVTFQAVSKWETGAGYPDVTLLPKIAAVFGTTVDHLLGGAPPAPDAAPRTVGESAGPASTEAFDPAAPDAPLDEESPEPAPAGDAGERIPEITVDVPGDLEIRVFCKGRPVGDVKVAGTVKVLLVGRARDVQCEASLVCEEIEGDVHAGANVDCRGDIGGDVNVGMNLRVKGDIGGDVRVGGSLECFGDIGGDVSAQKVTAGEIGGDVSADVVTAGEIGGDVSAASIRMRRDRGERDEDRRERDEERG